MTDAAKPTTSRSRFGTLTKHLKQYRGYLAIGSVAVILSNGLMLLNPLLTKRIFDKLEQHAPMSEVGELALAIFGLAILSGLFRFTMRRTIIWMSRRLEYDLRGELLSHLLKMSPSYYDNNRTGDIMARATNDLEAVRQLVGPAIMQISNTIVVATGSITMMILLSPRLTFYALLPAILLPLTMNRLGTIIHKRFAKIQAHFSQLTAVAQENLAGMRVVKAYRQEDNEAAHFGTMSDEYMQLNLGLGRLQALFLPLIQFIAGGLALVVLYFGGREVITGGMPLSTIVAFFLYLGMLTWPLMAIGWVVLLYQRGTASLDRINNILFTEPEISAVEDGHQAPIKGKIEFRELTFAYNGQPVLKDISLIIEPGRTLGIVGKTGSGKTSLVGLLSRLYPVASGQLLVDDVDVNDWQLHSLRSQIGFAPQEPFLFSRTMAENIGYGKENGNDAQIREVAATAALAKDIDEFPLGYQTMVGERGITLSGGQKQRTAIARAAMIDPSILVLDDATSSVDTETEFEINERIHARTKQLTTLIVSHRVSSVKAADLIIYLEDGRIVERGNHDELLAVNGRYAELHRTQLLAKEIESL